MAMGDQVAYFTGHTEDKRGNILYQLELETLKLVQISESYSNYEEDSPEPGYGACPSILYYFQETPKSLYYTTGWYAGTGRFYQSGSGHLVRVDKSDYSTTILSCTGDTSDSSGPKFYAFEENGREKVIFPDETGVIKIIDISDGSISDTDMPIGQYGVPFDNSASYETVNYWIYPAMDGKIVEITSEMSQKSTTGTYDRYENICYLETYVYYEKVYTKENPTPNSWRDYTIDVKREAYLIAVSTGETALLSSEDY